MYVYIYMQLNIRI